MKEGIINLTWLRTFNNYNSSSSSIVTTLVRRVLQAT